MKKIALFIIKQYQRLNLFAVCRFVPTCSDYTYQAIERYGTMQGLFMGGKRILRCHPWGGKGFDPVKIEDPERRKYV